MMKTCTGLVMRLNLCVQREAGRASEREGEGERESDREGRDRGRQTERERERNKKDRSGNCARGKGSLNDRKERD